MNTIDRVLFHLSNYSFAPSQPKGGYTPLFREKVAQVPDLRPASGRVWLGVALASLAVVVAAIVWWWPQHKSAPIPIAVLSPIFFPRVLMNPRTLWACQQRLGMLFLIFRILHITRSFEAPAEAWAAWNPGMAGITEPLRIAILPKRLN